MNTTCTNPENVKKVITPEIREQLRKPFPPEAITSIASKKFLSTLKQIYITERLNDVFGIGRWTMKTIVIKDNEKYVLMKGRLEIFDYDCVVPEQYGGHPTVGINTEIADGYKSAVTDCLSKSASYLEIGIDVFKGKGMLPVVIQNNASIVKTGSVIPTCSICSNPMKLSAKGSFYCKHENGVWGRKVYPKTIK